MNPLALQLVNRYREQHNPLRGLNIQSAVALLERAQSGDYADLQWLYKFIERRDPTLRAVKRRIFSSIKKLDWNIKVIDELPEGREDLAEKQREALRLAYERVENMRDALGALALAEFRGYSFLEKHWIKTGEKWHVHRLEEVPQWHWVRPGGDYGQWRINLDARSGGIEGEAVNLGNFVYREIDDPIDEVALFSYIRKNLSKKDWDGFIEVYGIPWIFLIMPQEASGDDWEKYLSTAREVMGDSRGVLPYGSEVKTADANNRGTNPFEAHARYQDEEIVLAGTGGLLTQLSKPTGIGEGASSEHADTFQAIAEEIAMDISEALQVHFDKPFLAAEFPDAPRLVYFELAARDEDDINDHFTRAKDAHQAGLLMDPDELSEKTGYKLTAAGDLASGAQPDESSASRQDATGEVRNRMADRDDAEDFDRYIERGEEQIGSALVAAHQDFLAAVQEAFAIEDEAERTAALADLRERLPDEFTAGANRLAGVFEPIEGTALVEGAIQGKIER